MRELVDIFFYATVIICLGGVVIKKIKDKKSDK